jgi:hypothetical protein
LILISSQNFLYPFFFQFLFIWIKFQTKCCVWCSQGHSKVFMVL